MSVRPTHCFIALLAASLPLSVAVAEQDIGDPYRAPAEQAPGPANPDADALSPGAPGEQEVPPPAAERPEQKPAVPPGQQPPAALPRGEAVGPRWLEEQEDEEEAELPPAQGPLEQASGDADQAAGERVERAPARRSERAGER